MTDSWKKMEEAKEDQFFDKENKKNLAGLGAGRASPVDGKPMTKKSLDGIHFEHCSSGGIFFDKQGLSALLKRYETEPDSKDWITKYLSKLLGQEPL